jgi:hypothetical protein
MKTIEDFRINKLLRQTALQTGNPRGTYKRNEPHPYVEGLFYYSWIEGKERWHDSDSVKRMKERDSRWNKSNKAKDAQLKHSRTEKRKVWTKNYQQTDAYKAYQDAYKKEGKRAKVQSRYKKSDKGKAKNNVYLSQRRVKERGFFSKMTQDEKLLLKRFYEWRVRIQKKLGIKFNVDHIIPLSVGGTHHPSNLQVVPAKWNRRKHNRNSDRWLPNGF